MTKTIWLVFALIVALVSWFFAPGPLMWNSTESRGILVASSQGFTWYIRASAEALSAFRLATMTPHVAISSIPSRPADRRNRGAADVSASPLIRRV